MRTPVACNVAFLTLCTLHAALSWESIASNFVMLDEFAHVPSGMYHLQRGRFDIYRENPPLVRTLAAIPAILAGAKADYSKMPGYRCEWAVGADFLLRNDVDIRRIFRGCRAVILLLGLSGGALIYRWVGETSGPVAGLACSALWLLDPTILAFDGVVTCDVGAAFFGGAAAYGFWRFAARPGWARAMIAGALLGLALGSKFTMLALLPCFSILTAILALSRRDRRLATQFAGLVATSLLVLNALYLFEGCFRRLSSFEFSSYPLSSATTDDVATPPRGNRFRGTPFGWVPMPAPAQFLLGLDSQRWESQVGLRSLGPGGLAVGGSWRSPLVTLSYKVPAGTAVAVALAVALLPASWRGRRLSVAVPLAAGASLMATLFLSPGLNWAVRYSIPAFLLLAVAIGPGVAAVLGRLPLRVALALMLAWNVSEIAHVRPHFLSYANAWAGGPGGGHRLLHGSNYDWGQDLYGLECWVSEHRGNAFCISYYGATPTSYLGLAQRALPASFLEGGPVAADHGRGDASAPFYWAVSSNILNGMTGRFVFDDGTVVEGSMRRGSLRPEAAVARVGYTIFIFEVDPRATGRLPSAIHPRELASCIRRHPPARDYIDAAP